MKDQIQSLPNKQSLKFLCLRSRGNTVNYDDSSPFDVYPVIVNAENKDKELLDRLEPGTIIFIDQGSIHTWNRKYNDNVMWNLMLIVDVKDILVLGKAKLVSYEDHLRVSKNTQKK